MNEELGTAKEANSRAPTTTMKNLVERLKNQLALKEKQHQVIVILLALKSLIWVMKSKIQPRKLILELLQQL